MEQLTEVKVEPFENNWKDWFVGDHEEKIKLTLFLDKTRKFYVNSVFKVFRVTSIIDTPCESVYDIYYIFDEPNPELKSTRGFTCAIDVDGNISNDRIFKAILYRDINV